MSADTAYMTDRSVPARIRVALVDGTAIWAQTMTKLAVLGARFCSKTIAMVRGLVEALPIADATTKPPTKRELASRTEAEGKL